MTTQPMQLSIGIGGFMGPSYSVELAEGRLRYQATGSGYADLRTEWIEPAAAQWSAFRDGLDAIGIWKWQPEYPNPGVCDGTQWQVEIVYADAMVRSHGDNNYPEADGTASGDPDSTPAFGTLMEHVRLLLGGREFH
jgi:hypothetical protein